MNRARIWLAVWLLGLLTPLAALGRFSPAYRLAFEAIFGPQWVHIVMHAGLYAGLSALLILALKLPLTRGNALLALLAVLCTGAAQESIQALSQGVSLLGGATRRQGVFDLGIDLLGGLLGLGVVAVVNISRGHRPLQARRPS